MTHYHVNSVFISPTDESAADEYFVPAIADREKALVVAQSWVAYMAAVCDSTSNVPVLPMEFVNDDDGNIIGYETFDIEGHGVRSTVSACEVKTPNEEGALEEFVQKLTDAYGDGEVRTTDDGYIVSIDPVTAMILEAMGLGETIGFKDATTGETEYYGSENAAA